jgi:hypothetical protein
VGDGATVGKGVGREVGVEVAEAPQAVKTDSSKIDQITSKVCFIESMFLF